MPGNRGRCLRALRVLCRSPALKQDAAGSQD